MPPHDRLYRTEGVIIRRHDLGEADRILTIFTRDHGKLRAVGKGVRKPLSKSAGHLELFTRSDLLLAQGRDLDVISQAETIDAFIGLRGNLERSSYASHFAELVDAFTEDRDEQRALYNVFVAALGWLTRTTDPARTAAYFELHLLDFAGYRLELFNCVVNGEEIEAQNQFYSAEAGGVICPACGANYPRSDRITLRALKVLRYMQRRSFDAIEQLELSERAKREVENLLHHTLSYHLERRLKSADFLKRLRREARK
jgi:DNA repair protein RecO (recombination protein O)